MKKVVKGLEILQAVPEIIVPQIIAGSMDQGLRWDDIKDDCTLTIDDNGGGSLKYGVGGLDVFRHLFVDLQPRS